MPKISANWCINSSNNSGKTFLLPTIPVSVGYGSNKTIINCLLDTGSQRSYVSKDVLKRLNIEGSNKTTYLINTFVESSHRPLSESCLTIKIENAKPVSLPFLVDDSFSLSLNIAGLKDAHANISQCHNLAGQLYSDNVVLEGLLGVDALQYFKQCDLVSCLGGVAYKVCSGIIPFGNIDNFLTNKQLTDKYSSQQMPVQPEASVDSTLINFVLDPTKTTFDPIGSVIKDSVVESKLDLMFNLDSIGITEEACDDDLKQIKLFSDSINLVNGQYEVKLPWNNNIEHVKSNYYVSKAILDKVKTNLEQRNLYEAYNAVLQQQLQDGILEEISLSDINIEEHVWVPHRPVVKMEDQVTTKVRVVLNCSLKVDDNPSLNEASYPGINLINDLMKLLIRIRANSYLTISDIKRAFLMIKLKEITDRNKFSILWKTKDNKLKAYRYKTIVFGSASSPFILHQVIRHHIRK